MRFPLNALSHLLSLSLLFPFFSYPTTNCGMPNGSSYILCHTHCIHVFARLVPTCMLINILTKFLHQSSVKSSPRVHCWLGTTSTRRDWDLFPLSPLKKRGEGREISSPPLLFFSHLIMLENGLGGWCSNALSLSVWKWGAFIPHTNHRRIIV